MEFHYTAQDKNGKRVIAKANADSVPVLVTQLKAQGLLPIKIKPAEKNRIVKSIKDSNDRRGKVSLKDLAIFTRQLASALKAGILLSEALETIGQDWHSVYFRHVLKGIFTDIRAGKSFSGSLARFPDTFSPTYIALVKAGEETGNLAETLSNLADYLQDTAIAIQKFKTAIRYPLFIFCFFLFVVFVLVFFIIPKFKVIFAKAGANLPLLTRVVVGISEFIIRNILWLVPAGLILGFLAWLSLKAPRIKFYFDRHKLGIPIMGNIMQKTLIARFSRTLSILISGGVGLATSLNISVEVVDNLYFKAILDKIKARVLSGFSLSSEMERQQVFEKMFVKMVQVGERTGKISQMLAYNADYSEQELGVAITNFTSLLEPVLIVLIGGVVLIVILAMYLPIFTIATLRR